MALFRAAWRMERVPEIAGSMIVFERADPDDGSSGNGCREGEF